MNRKECSDLAVNARALGYVTEVKPILGGTYRLYLTKPAGRWTFVVDEEDLADVHADSSLWVTTRYAGSNDAGEQGAGDIAGPLDARPAWTDEELNEWERLAFNPDALIDVTLPSGAVAHVARDAAPETLAALDRVTALMIAQFTLSRSSEETDDEL